MVLRTKGFIALVVISGLLIGGGAMYNHSKDKEVVPIHAKVTVVPPIVVEEGDSVEYTVVVKEIEAAHEEVLSDVEKTVESVVEPSDISGRNAADTPNGGTSAAVNKQGE